MSGNAFDVVPLAAHRIACLSQRVAGMEQVPPAVGPLFDRLADALVAAGRPPQTDPSLATYTFGDDGSVLVTVGFPAGDGGVPDGVEVLDVPAVERAATYTHRGSMRTIGDSWQALMRWADEQGWVTDGPTRELYLATPADDPDAWVTELQQPVRRA